ncbi:uncharacterized protein G2W53_038197 [Senna tora]|uniref:Uncharacterized protein n=1 Tax=Senna tora TaxID=362788 RepID=A0A834SMK4_9FABA|nr:uncharacterized protein G2W53_038197 [Senna tora]
MEKKIRTLITSVDSIASEHRAKDAYQLAARQKPKP